MPVNDAANELSSAQNYVSYDDNNRTGMGWLLPLLLLVLAIGIFFYFKNDNYNYSPVTAPQFIDTQTNATVNSNHNAILPDSLQKHLVQIQLKDTSITVFKGGIEYGLVLFVSSKKGYTEPTESPSFDFDSLEFKGNTAQLASSSMHEIKNVATILKAYPHARIKITSYTDKTNNISADLKLSQERGRAVMTALENEGTNYWQLLGVEAFGSKYAMFGADASEEQRARDRRVAIEVMYK